MSGDPNGTALHCFARRPPFRLRLRERVAPVSGRRHCSNVASGGPSRIVTCGRNTPAQCALRAVLATSARGSSVPAAMSRHTRAVPKSSRAHSDFPMPLGPTSNSARADQRDRSRAHALAACTACGLPTISSRVCKGAGIRGRLRCGGNGAGACVGVAAAMGGATSRGVCCTRRLQRCRCRRAVRCATRCARDGARQRPLRRENIVGGGSGGPT